MGDKREVSVERIAKAIYAALAEAGPNAYLGIYKPGQRVTIDGRFNLDRAAMRLHELFASGRGEEVRPPHQASETKMRGSSPEQDEKPRK